MRTATEKFLGTTEVFTHVSELGLNWKGISDKKWHFLICILKEWSTNICSNYLEDKNLLGELGSKLWHSSNEMRFLKTEIKKILPGKRHKIENKD